MKILYRISQPAHQRVFEKLQPIDGVEQIIVGPPEEEEDMPNYGYKDFGIQNIITYPDTKNLSNIIRDINPDIYVDSVFSFFRKNTIFGSIPKSCRLAYIHHGFCSRGSAQTYELHRSIYGPGWMRQANKFSIACGCSNLFYEWSDVLGIDRSKVILNATPQLDLFYDSNYYNSRKPEIISKLGIDNDTKIMLYFGRFAGPGKEFDKTNKEFLDVLFYLYDIAVRNNMLLLVKPKLSADKIEWYIKKYMSNIYESVIKKFTEIKNSANVHFINTNKHIYQYFFADIVVLNSASSSEVESILAGKPTITVNLVKNDVFEDDVHDAIACGAAIGVQNAQDLEGTILSALYDNEVRNSLLVGRNILMERHNIIFDGNNHKRAQDAILSLCEG